MMLVEKSENRSENQVKRIGMEEIAENKWHECG